MTELEFKKSLTKDQAKFYDGAIKEAFRLEEKYYRETVALKEQIMLILFALNIKPIASIPVLHEMVADTLDMVRKRARYSADKVPDKCWDCKDLTVRCHSCMMADLYFLPRKDGG